MKDCANFSRLTDWRRLSLIFANPSSVDLSHGFNKSRQKKSLYRRPGSLLSRAVLLHILNVTLIISEHRLDCTCEHHGALKGSSRSVQQRDDDFRWVTNTLQTWWGKICKFRTVCFVLMNLKNANLHHSNVSSATFFQVWLYRHINENILVSREDLLCRDLCRKRWPRLVFSA